MRTNIHARTTPLLTFSQVGGGFTLLETLTVIVVGGILAALSLPYFYSRAVAAKQAEGKMLVGTINRAQQAFYTQNARFSNTINDLTLNLKSANYEIEVRPGQAGQPYVLNYATSKLEKVRSYVGMAAIVQDSVGNLAMQTVICEAEAPGAVEATKPIYSVSTIECAPRTQQLK